jgi:ferrous-iron efflux pump FieF
MLGSLADTGLDLIASLITLYGVRSPRAPADRDHRFGHGKAEALAALVQVVLIAFSALGIGWRAVDRLLGGGDRRRRIWHRRLDRRDPRDLRPARLPAPGDRRTGSVAIATDHVHYQSDLLLNLSVIAALVLDQYARAGRRRRRCSASPSPCGCCGARGAPRAAPSTS